MAQVVSGFETVWENTVIRSRDRIQTIIASCNPTGELATPLFQRLRSQIEAMDLPPGYSLSWGGEYEDSARAQGALADALPGGFLLMILTSILLFGKVRQPLIIWLTVPLAVVGITAGLLAFNAAFDFMSLLGALSLVGLLIKNAIVLIEEIDQQIEEGKPPYTAILDSGVSRLAPGGSGCRHYHPGPDSPAAGRVLRQHVHHHHGRAGLRHRPDPDRGAGALRDPVPGEGAKVGGEVIAQAGDGKTAPTLSSRCLRSSAMLTID